MMRLRIPLQASADRRLRTLLYGRYSTQEQHPSSIEDQIAYCKEFLARHGIADPELETLTDTEMSGELVSRPGIDQVRAGVAARRWELIVVEDSGRLFRHETACGELIEAAVDNGIRVVCINDGVDTAEEDWEDPLHEALLHHARSNRYTAKRIKRKLEGLWRQGAAIGLLRSGYQRRPTQPATQHGPEQGPFFDAVDPRWAPVVRSAFERVARQDPPWLVAQWLSQQGLPKCPNAVHAIWTERNVLALIRRTVYRGLEAYRFTVVKKHYRSGRHEQVRNEPAEVLTREMPHLRMVPDELWYAANRAIEDRRRCTAATSGAGHPLAGIPRDSRGPLSGVLHCGVCGGKMYMEGRKEGGYRCGNARRGTCWNKATAARAVAHAQIYRAVLAQVMHRDGVLDLVIAEVLRRLRDETPWQRKLAELQGQEAKVLMTRQRLLQAIEQGKDYLEVLVTRLRGREAELTRLGEEIARVQSQAIRRPSLPCRRQILTAIHNITNPGPVLDHALGVPLRTLVGPIRAVPYQQFGGPLVVLRARFEMRWIALLPHQWQALFCRASVGAITGTVEATMVVADLFHRPAGPKHYARALELSAQGKSLVRIGHELGIGKRQAHLALQYGSLLQKAGLTDPYVELTAAPLAASRWRRHPKLASGMESRGRDV
jgi:DNA invertase Pin-like site-specific DNA recombinase